MAVAEDRGSPCVSRVGGRPRTSPRAHQPRAKAPAAADGAGAAGPWDRSPRVPRLGRQALHAAVLGFRHPISKQPMNFQAPLPADLRDLITLLRTHRHVDTPTVAGATIDLEKMLAGT